MKYIIIWETERNYEMGDAIVAENRKAAEEYLLNRIKELKSHDVVHINLLVKE